MQITLEYWNTLANQTILISSLLGGFSIAVVANLMVSDKTGKVYDRILQSAILSAGCFLVALFSMMQISMLTTPGGPLENVTSASFSLPRLIGVLSLIIGIFSIMTMIAMSGWTKSKQVGRFSTVVAIITLLLILLSLFDVNT